MTLTLAELDALIADRTHHGSAFNFVSEDDDRVAAFWNGEEVTVDIPGVGECKIQIKVTL